MPKQHNSKEIKQLFKKIEKLGFTITAKNKKGVVKILPPDSIEGPVYFTHGTQSAYHQMIRDFNRMYQVDLAETETAELVETK
jgi:hypothetical protein